MAKSEYDVSGTVKKKKKKKVLDDEPVKKKKKRVVEDEDHDEPPKKKKKKAKVEDEPVVKKKKKKAKGIDSSMDLMGKILDDMNGNGSRKRGSISRTDTSKLVSIIGEHAENIHQLLESEDVDAAAMAIRKRALMSMVDILPYIEDNIRSSGGKQGSYHLKSIYECVHSILGELQALKDRDAIARNFVADVLQPYAVSITNTLIQELNNILTDTRNLVQEDKKQELNQVLNNARVNMGQSLNAQYIDLRNVALSYLQNNI